MYENRFEKQKTKFLFLVPFIEREISSSGSLVLYFHIQTIITKTLGETAQEALDELCSLDYFEGDPMIMHNKPRNFILMTNSMN